MRWHRLQTLRVGDLSAHRSKSSFELAKAENAACNSSRTGALFHTTPVVSGLRTNLINSVPTNDQILVPETLLKKRKSQEKARAERADAIQKQKAVSIPPCVPFGI